MTRDRRSGDDHFEVGSLLRTFRTVAGLTQEALAERAGVGVRSIQGFELGERRPRRDTAHRLIDALGLSGLDRLRFETAAQVLPPRRPREAPVDRAVGIGTEAGANPPPRHDLPVPLSSFVGRTRELAELERCLGSTRLLTLTGPPGVGKTRLALAVAARQSEVFVDGVQFVSLAAICDPDLVPATIARSIGVEGTERQPLVDRLAEVLREARLLLLLDNFEQVAAAGPVLSKLLEACPRLAALVTSRTRLRVRGEREFAVPALPLPDDGPGPRRAGSIAWILESEAARLFVARAREARSDFEVTRENAPIIAEICRRLDGSPLAIELAAAWLRTLNLPSLLVRLTDRLALLTAGSADLPQRQQTWRQAIAWSYDLLGPADQALFRRLAVFSGGFTFPAAEVSGGATLAALTTLLDTSLVQRVGSASCDSVEPRFSLLETIRDFADERLVESGEARLLRRRHAEYFLAFAEVARSKIEGPEEKEALDALESEHDNLRAALGFHLDEADAERAFRLVNALGKLWAMRGYVDEARRWLVRILELARASGNMKDQADALQLSGRMAWKESDNAVAWVRLEESLTLARQVGDRPGTAESLALLGLVARDRGEYALSRSLLWESLEMYRQLGDAPGVAAQLDRVGIVAFYQGDVATARALLEESLIVREPIGDHTFIAWAHELLGELAHGVGDWATARSEYERSLTIWREQGFRYGMLCALLGLADLALDEGDLADARSCLVATLELGRIVADRRGMIRAVEILAGLAAARGNSTRCLRLAGAADALRTAIGEPCPPDQWARLTRRLATARAMLSEEAAGSAWAGGGTLTLEKAIADGLAESSA
jgi:predicted ATPase/transcriptional regulator with XRE-family HTH domain